MKKIPAAFTCSCLMLFTFAQDSVRLKILHETGQYADLPQNTNRWRQRS